MKLFSISIVGAIFLVVLAPQTTAQVVLNEIDVVSSPQQIELYNTGTTAVDISGWYLDDSGGTTYVTIPANSTIYPERCIVVQGGFNLNTASSDTARLFDSSSTPVSATPHLLDSFIYSKKPTVTGENFSRNPDGLGQWITTSATIGSFNSSEEDCLGEVIIEPTGVPTPTITPTPEQELPQEEPSPSPEITSEPERSPTPTLIPTEQPTPTEVPTLTPSVTFAPSQTPTVTPLMVQPSTTPSFTSTPSPTKTPTFTPTSTVTSSLTPTSSSLPAAISNIYISEVLSYPNSGNSEVVEFYNNNPFEVTLSNWSIDDATYSGSSPKVFTLTILGNSYEVYELPSAIFNNAGDEVTLLNDKEMIEDFMVFDGGEQNKSWSRQSIETDVYCQTNQTFGEVNEACGEEQVEVTPIASQIPISTNSVEEVVTPTRIVTSTKTPSPTKTPTKTPSIPTATPTASPTYVPIQGIYLSEIYAAPASGEHEWVELYNSNDSPVNLPKWFLDDGENTGGSPKEFSTTIDAHGYVIIELGSGIYNNAGDQVRLLNPKKEMQDSLEYEDAEEEYSISRHNVLNTSVCSTNMTPGFENSVCVNESQATVLGATVKSTIQAATSTVKPTPKQLASTSLKTTKVTTPTVSKKNQSNSSFIPAAVAADENSAMSSYPYAPSKIVPLLGSSISGALSVLAVLALLMRARFGMLKAYAKKYFAF